jgi:hypothetical protein
MGTRQALHAFFPKHAIEHPAGAAVSEGDEYAAIGASGIADRRSDGIWNALGTIVQQRRDPTHIQMREPVCFY